MRKKRREKITRTAARRKIGDSCSGIQNRKSNSMAGRRRKNKKKMHVIFKVIESTEGGKKEGNSRRK